MGKLDDLGGAVRRMIGDLADDREVYYPFSNIQSPADTYLGRDVLEQYGDFVPPPPGSESGMVSPHYLLLRHLYPGDLAAQAAGRTKNSRMQAPVSPGHIPLLARPGGYVSTGGDFGRHLSQYQDGQRVGQYIDVGGHDDALRTLIHEARHATERPFRDHERAWTSISSQRPVVEGRRLTDASRRYFARPSEVLAYLGEAGDDFVRERGRLVNDARDANAVMERVEAGESLERLHPLVRKMYSDAYKQNQTARANINELLTRYFAVPMAAAAGGAASEQQAEVR
jgi:hypothetical protein